MSRDKVIYLAVGVALGLIVGFVISNNINSRELEQMRGELARLRASAPPKEAAAGGPQVAAADGSETSLPSLTDEELRNAVAKADASPGDATLQRTAGQGLYLYAMQTGNSALLPDVARILKRAHEANPNDYPVTVLAGNAHFLVARGGGGDAGALREARKYYERALAAKPDDIVVRTSLGLTYFFDRPADAARAAREYRKALEIDPRHEMPLQSLAAALIETGEFAEAEKRLRELEGVNPSNPELPNLRAQLAQKQNASKERD